MIEAQPVKCAGRRLIGGRQQSPFWKGWHQQGQAAAVVLAAQLMLELRGTNLTSRLSCGGSQVLT